MIIQTSDIGIKIQEFAKSVLSKIIKQNTTLLKHQYKVLSNIIDDHALLYRCWQLYRKFEISFKIL